MRVFLDTFMHYGPVSNNTEQIAAAAFLPKKWTGNFFATPMPNGPNGMNCCALGTLRITVPPDGLFANVFKFKINGLTGGTFGTGALCAMSAVDINHNLRDIFSLRLEDDGTLSIWALDNIMNRSTFAIHEDTWYTIETNCQIAGAPGHPIRVAATSRINGFGLVTGSNDANISVDGLLSGRAEFTSHGFNGSSKGQAYIALPIIYDSVEDAGATWNLTARRSFGNPVFWAGDCVAGVIFPNGQVLAQWDSTGANNWGQILNNPANLAKFVSTATVNNKDALDWDDIASLPVMTAQMNLYATKNDVGSRAISERFGSGSGTLVSAITGLANDPLYIIGGHDNDPATGLRWTKATFDPTQWGYNLDI